VESAAPEAELGILVDALHEHSMQSLFICLSHSWGGLEQVAAGDALDAAMSGLNVRVLCLEGSPLHQHLTHRKELTTLPLNFRPRDYFDFKLRRELYRLFSEGVNLVHTHQTSLLGSITPWLWNWPEIALFASRHIMCSHDKRNFFHGAIYSRLDALVVMSQTLRRNVIETHPLRERQVKVVNLGLDFNRFDPDKVDPIRQRTQWGADNDSIVVGLVGRLDPAKGQATFIKAAAGLMQSLREGERIKFVIVGEETLGRSSTYLSELKEMVAQFHLEDYVIFAGYQENIPEVMRSFDIFVMPSRQEAFGLVAIEAMAMECPIIISSGGSAAEIVGQEEFGLLMVPEDAFDLKRQLRHMLDNPMERIQMGQRAREHVKRNYDRRVRLRKTLELYERVLRRRVVIT
jgi:glycosyltransferase involved in cell wall biosynthesis